MAIGLLQPRREARWRIARAVLCCLLAGCFCLSASALGRTETFEDLRHTSWGAKEGAPGGALSMAQSADGFMWMGNVSGLFRFDGLRFERFAIPHADRLASGQVYKVFAPASGGLWIGFTFGGAAFLDGDSATIYAEEEGLPPGSVKDFVQDDDGVIWAATTTGLARLRDGRWQKVGPAEGFSDSQAEALMVDTSGTLWSLTKNRLLSLRKGESRFRKTVLDPALRRPIGMVESADGTVWSLDWRGINAVGRATALVPGGRRPSAGLLLVDRDDVIWIKREERDEVDRFKDIQAMREQFATPGDTFSSGGLHFTDAGNGFVEDREGNVWFSSGAGVERFSERNVAVMAFPQRLHIDPLQTCVVAGDDGSVWLGSREPFASVNVRGKALMPLDGVESVTAVVEGADGAWFGSATGIWHFGGGALVRTELPAEWDGFEVQALAEDHVGLWASIIRKGIFRLSDGKWTPGAEIAPLPVEPAVAISSAPDGRVWFGFVKSRIAVLDGRTVRMFQGADEVPVGTVLSLFTRRGTVWAAGEFGVARFDGQHFRRLVPESGTRFDSVTGLVETASGDLWFNADAGIVRVAASDLAAFQRDPARPVRSELFDASDDVRGTSARLRPLPTATEAGDGKLVFARNTGMYMVDPNHLVRNAVPPLLKVTSLTAGSTSFAAAKDVRLPKGTRSIRIDFAALSFTKAEKIRFRYRLDGVDADWQDSHARQAFYTNLAPGKHSFRLMADNGDGVWNTEATTIDFVISPRFVQTGWFAAMCIVAAAAAVWLVVSLRVRQVSRRLRTRIEDRAGERVRIAKDLHDNLLQGTQGLILRFHAATQNVATGDPGRAGLEKALRRADALIEDGRARVTDLRVPEDTWTNLPEALAAAGHELAYGTGIAFHAEVAGRPRSLRREVNLEAYRIGREAMLNASRRAGATRIECKIEFGARTVEMRIRDDGERSPQAPSDAASVRLESIAMCERAKRIGATLGCSSASGSGTDVTLTIPNRHGGRGWRALCDRLVLRQRRK